MHDTSQGGRSPALLHFTHTSTNLTRDRASIILSSTKTPRFHYEMPPDTDRSTVGSVESSSQAPLWNVLEFTCSERETDCEMIAVCNGRRVVVCLSEDNLPESSALKEKYLFFVKVANEFELDGYVVEDFWDWIAESLLPFFHQLNDLDSVGDTLDKFFFPQMFFYTLKAEGESVVAGPISGDEDNHPVFGERVPEDVCSSWPSIDPSEVRVCDLSGTEKVVLRDGTTAYLKLMRHGDKRFIVTELSTYAKNRDSDLDSSLRISRLFGLVRSPDGKILGLLLTYIDGGRRTLSCTSRRPDVPQADRRMWAAQIETTIAELHRAGIAWGDAKPDNVLIAYDNNAWLIDFGGSYTEGWVPKELSGTMEGDLVGLEKIKEYLGVEREPPNEKVEEA